MQFAAPAIPVVRIGYGNGGRGSGAVSRMTNIKNVEIKALCDIREAAVKSNQETLKRKGLPAAAEYFGSETAFKKMCERDYIDLIYIATSWDWHTPIALYAMEHGKHVAAKCPQRRRWKSRQLVETSERTRQTLYAVGELLL